MNNPISSRSLGFPTVRTSLQPSSTATPDCRCLLNANYTFGTGAQVLELEKVDRAEGAPRHNELKA
jgi:hypothetical protein